MRQADGNGPGCLRRYSESAALDAAASSRTEEWSLIRCRGISGRPLPRSIAARSAPLKLVLTPCGALRSQSWSSGRGGMALEKREGGADQELRDHLVLIDTDADPAWQRPT